MPETGTNVETAGVRRRRRGALLVPLVGVGVAAWAVRRRRGDRRGPADGWHALPPAPPYAPVVRAEPEPAAEAAAAEATTQEMVLPAPPVAAPPAPARAVPAAVAVASVAAPTGPTATDVPGALPALAGGTSPDPGYVVKGKVATRTFHVPGGAYYTRTRADVWFRTPDDARAAGFTERVRRPK